MRHFIYTPRSGSKIIGGCSLIHPDRLRCELENSSHLLLGDYHEISWGSGSRNFRANAAVNAAVVASTLGGVAIDDRGDIRLYVPGERVEETIAYGRAMGVDPGIAGMIADGLMVASPDHGDHSLRFGQIQTRWRFQTPTPLPRIVYHLHGGILAWRYEDEDTYRLERGVRSVLGGVEKTADDVGAYTLDLMTKWANAHRHWCSNSHDLIRDAMDNLEFEGEEYRSVKRRAWQRCLEMFEPKAVDLNKISWPIPREVVIETLHKVGACANGIEGELKNFGETISREEAEAWFADPANAEEVPWAKKALRLLGA